MDKVAQALIQSFQLQSVPGSEVVDPLEHVRLQVEQKVLFLLRTNMEALFQILYRLDVSEEITDQCFALGRIEEVARAMSHAILERELKKEKAGAHRR